MQPNVQRRRGSFLVVLLALALVAISVGLAFRGWSFYQMSVEDRVEHPDFRALRSSGTLGNGYGWVAALLIVMNLSYLVRRRFGSSGLGGMKVWLDVHVFTGLTAATLVSFHSAFQLRTTIATASTASLLIVVVTGLVGRFLYTLVPTASRERLAAALDAVERIAPGQREPLADALGKLPGPVVSPSASLARSIIAIPAWLRAGRARRATVDAMLPAQRARAEVKELRIAATLDARASGIAALLRSWRGLHRLFALLMLSAVLLHAGVAWYFGYRWIFA